MRSGLTAATGAILAFSCCAALVQTRAADIWDDTAPDAPAVRSAGSSASRPASKPATAVSSLMPYEKMPFVTGKFPLQAAMPLPLPEYSPKQLETLWPIFQHAPFESAGVNPLILPFRYKSLDSSGDDREGCAMSFLMSFLLDWIPGNYAEMRPYSIFEQDKAICQELRAAYDGQKIAQLMRKWNATCAVGGEIVQSVEGYRGMLEVYGRDGKVWTQKYDQPGGFFDLLGDMSVDACKQMGFTPTEKLTAEMHRPTCQAEVLGLLGSAAFCSLREQTDIFEKILQQDEDFSLVRICWAWEKFQGKELQQQCEQALQSGPSLQTLFYFQPETCQDEELVVNWKKWMNTAEAIVGADHPDLLSARMSMHERRNEGCSGELLDRAIDAGRRYPNDRSFLVVLAGACGRSTMPGNTDLNRAIWLAASQGAVTRPDDSRINTASYYYAWDHAVINRPDLMLSTMKHLREGYLENNPNNAAFTTLEIAKACQMAGHYAEAAKEFQEAYKRLGIFRDPSPERQRQRLDALADSLICAVIAGEKQMYEGLLQDHGDELDKSTNPDLLRAYMAVARGEQPKASGGSDEDYYWQERRFIFDCQVALMKGRQNNRSALKKWLNVSPSSRAFWVLMDGYDRLRSQDGTCSFYEELEWVYGDDPWVAQAVADYRKRHARIVPPNPAEILRILKSYEAVLHPPGGSQDQQQAADTVVMGFEPGAVGAAVKMLVQNGDFDKARELTLRMNSAAVQAGRKIVQNHMGRVLLRVEQARQAATRPASRPATRATQTASEPPLP